MLAAKNSNSAEIAFFTFWSNVTISKFEFETYELFGKDMAALTSASTKIRWDVPTIVGACILELAKFEMYKFHYEVMKPNFNCHLLYSVTSFRH